MGQCTKCGARFVNAPETPTPDQLCKYCQIDEMKAAISDLRAKLASAEADARRLDVLDRLAKTYCISLAYFSDGRIDVVFRNEGGTFLTHKYESLRAAIDAAMGEKGGVAQ